MEVDEERDDDVSLRRPSSNRDTLSAGMVDEYIAEAIFNQQAKEPSSSFAVDKCYYNYTDEELRDLGSLDDSEDDSSPEPPTVFGVQTRQHTRLLYLPPLFRGQEVPFERGICTDCCEDPLVFDDCASSEMENVWTAVQPEALQLRRLLVPCFYDADISDYEDECDGEEDSTISTPETITDEHWDIQPLCMFEHSIVVSRIRYVPAFYDSDEESQDEDATPFGSSFGVVFVDSRLMTVSPLALMDSKSFMGTDFDDDWGQFVDVETKWDHLHSGSRG